jgi:hypothetical protein
MRKPLLACSVLAVSFIASAQTKAERTFPVSLLPGNMPPAFGHGYVALYGLDPKVPVYRRDGALAFDFTLPQDMHLGSVALDSDGSAAFAVQSSSNAAVALVKPNGEADVARKDRGFRSL